MYKLYEVKKTKSQVRGYWIDKGKLYKDNISINKKKDRQGLNKGIKKLFSKGELSVFYTQGNKAYIQNKQGNIKILYKRLRLHRKKLSCKEFKKLVFRFGGLTCYKLKDRYILEIFYN